MVQHGESETNDEIIDVGRLGPKISDMPSTSSLDALRNVHTKFPLMSSAKTVAAFFFPAVFLSCMVMLAWRKRGVCEVVAAHVRGSTDVPENREMPDVATKACVQSILKDVIEKEFGEEVNDQRMRENRMGDGRMKGRKLQLQQLAKPDLQRIGEHHNSMITISRPWNS